ncbi:MAG TPA: HNH endonuclease [Thermoanaerobaculia bacterium]|nr:HNH endonuclease [Thermoanaerobaculia bacterium]
MLSETRLRLDAIHFARALRERWVAVPAAELRRFRIHLKGQQGIFKPAELSDPLSITTTISSAYTHDTIEGSCVYYDFVPRSREHENEGLKRCAEAALPLIYFLQVKARPAEHVVFAPVYVIGWDDDERRFLVDLSEQRPDEFVTPAPAIKQLHLPQIRTPESPGEIRELTKSYTITTVQRRLQQARFRDAVLRAWRERCAVCELRLGPLLDAAMLDGDRGIALCATHHRAFDMGMIAIDDAFVVRVKIGAAGEGEQAMLLAYDGKKLAVPASYIPRDAPPSAGRPGS